MSMTSIKWLGDMAFEVGLNDFHFFIDAEKKFGGKNKGCRPKGLLLSSLGGCTGMDVVSILKKMKITNFDLQINVNGEMTDEHPKIYHTINIEYTFTGKNLPLEKLKRAVELSETRYCGVSAMLKKSANIHTKITVNEGN